MTSVLCRQKLRFDAPPTEIQAKLAIAQALSLPSIYNSPVIVLDFDIDDNDLITGRFKDASRPRVFEFEMGKDGISFKPFIPSRMDGIEINPNIWQDFSAGFTYRIDATTQKRKDKPECGNTSYSCGKACISLNKNCKSNPKDPVSVARIEKAVEVVKATKGTKKKATSKNEEGDVPPQAETQSKEAPPPKEEKVVQVKPTTGLVGDGTHEGSPKDTQEYLAAVKKSGGKMTSKEAQSITTSIKGWSRFKSGDIRADQKKGIPNKDADNIEKFIRTSTPYKGEVHRGMAFSRREDALAWIKGDKDGLLDNQNAHASWSSDPKIAEKFATKLAPKGGQAVIIKSVNKTGAPIERLTLTPGESEVIVSKGARHKVKSVTEKDGVITVEVEEVDSKTEDNTPSPVTKQAKTPSKTTPKTPKEPKNEKQLKAPKESAPPSKEVVPEPSAAKTNFSPSKMTPKEAKDLASDWQVQKAQYLINSKKKKDVEKAPLLTSLNVALRQVSELASDPGFNTTAIKDGSGQVQGIYMTDASQSKDFLYIDALSTNPKNIMEEKKGVGKAIIYHAAKESIEKGLKGKIELYALDTAVPFYKAVGFKPVPGLGNEMRLDEQAAKDFISKYEKSLNIEPKQQEINQTESPTPAKKTKPATPKTPKEPNPKALAKTKQAKPPTPAAKPAVAKPAAAKETPAPAKEKDQPKNTYTGGQLSSSSMTPEESRKFAQDSIKSNWAFLGSKEGKDIKKRDAINDADLILWMLSEQGRKPKENISTTALKDDNGNIQGYYLANSDKSKSKKALYIEALGTNPQNIINEVKGVGKQIIYNAIKESAEKGFNGKISLTALPDAVPFYEAVGFKKSGSGKHDFDLSEEDAKAFMSKYEKSLNPK